MCGGRVCACVEYQFSQETNARWREQDFLSLFFSACQPTTDRDWRKKRKPVWSSAGVDSGPCFKRSKTDWRQSSGNWFLTGAHWQVSWCKKQKNSAQPEKKEGRRLAISFSVRQNNALLSVYTFIVSLFLPLACTRASQGTLEEKQPRVARGS